MVQISLNFPAAFPEPEMDEIATRFTLAGRELGIPLVIAGRDSQTIRYGFDRDAKVELTVNQAHTLHEKLTGFAYPREVSADFTRDAWSYNVTHKQLIP